MTRFGGTGPSRIVRSLVLAAALIGCAANPVHYSAMLNQPDGLGPGDPVTHGGSPIGSVTTVTPGSGGNSQVSVRVDSRYTTTVRTDSILVLHGAGAAPSLEMMTPGMTGAEASDGAVLYGASNPNQEEILVNILGPLSMASTYGQFFNQAAPPQASPSPGSTVLQNQLMDIFRQTLAAATAATSTTPMGRAQMDQFREDADAVAQQLDAHGRAAEAQQLRAQVARMNAAAAAAGSAPNTLTVPRAAPSP
jgi:hypothetical protein